MKDSKTTLERLTESFFKSSLYQAQEFLIGKYHSLDNYDKSEKIKRRYVLDGDIIDKETSPANFNEDTYSFTDNIELDYAGTSLNPHDYLTNDVKREITDDINRLSFSITQELGNLFENIQENKFSNIISNIHDEISTHLFILNSLLNSQQSKRIHSAELFVINNLINKYKELQNFLTKKYNLKNYSFTLYKQDYQSKLPLIYQILTEKQLIICDEDDFISIFNNQIPKSKIIWQITINELIYFINELENNNIIQKPKKGVGSNRQKCGRIF